MWLVWLVFCDCGFHSVGPLMHKDEKLMEASWWEILMRGKLCLILMGGAMLSKSLIQFSVDMQGCVPSLLFDLRPNYSEGNGSSVQFSLVAQSCPTPCDPMNWSAPGLLVHHQLPEFTQTHVHRVSDAIQPSHPLLSPSLPVPNPFQHQGLFQWVNSSHQVAKVLEFQLQHQSFQRTPRTDLL